MKPTKRELFARLMAEHARLRDMHPTPPPPVLPPPPLRLKAAYIESVVAAALGTLSDYDRPLKAKSLTRGMLSRLRKFDGPERAPLHLSRQRWRSEVWPVIQKSSLWALSVRLDESGRYVAVDPAQVSMLEGG